MPGTPQFGGSNNVPELDIGQVGSVRRAAGTANATVHVLEGSDGGVQVLHSIPQQYRGFRDVLGRGLKRVAWEAMLRCVDNALWRTIQDEMNTYMAGIGRTAETTLTDGFGATISTRAVLNTWQPTDRLRRLSNAGTLTLIVPVRIEFVCL